MTLDEAKAELRSIRALGARIAERKRRLASLRASVQNVRISRYGETVGSTDKDRVEKCLDKLSGFEEELLADIPRLEALKASIIAKIEVLPYPQCEVLMRYYVDGQPMDVIARLMHYSRRNGYKIHDKGVERYAKIGEKWAQKDTKDGL